MNTIHWKTFSPSQLKFSERPKQESRQATLPTDYLDYFSVEISPHITEHGQKLFSLPAAIDGANQPEDSFAIDYFIPQIPALSGNDIIEFRRLPKQTTLAQMPVLSLTPLGTHQTLISLSQRRQVPGSNRLPSTQKVILAEVILSERRFLEDFNFEVKKRTIRLQLL